MTECVGCGRPDTELCELCELTAWDEFWHQLFYAGEYLLWDEMKQEWRAL